MEKLIDIKSTPIVGLLDLIVKDKTTGKNIIWATGNYADFGEGYSDREQITKEILLNHPNIIKPRVQKDQEVQAERTKVKAEVMTPGFIIDEMVNYLDEDWFGRKDVFNHLNDDHTWTVNEEKVEFPEEKKKDWKHYVDSRRLEITCGEAPYIVSRYDTTTGELIVPPKRRVGMLDRKLRVINENTEDYDTWLKWVIRAYEATYGYEYCGDSLVIARINLILTFCDYYRERWNREPEMRILRKLANKIVWNIWQMDGLNDTVPFGKPYQKHEQMSLFDFVDDPEPNAKPEQTLCRIKNWRAGNSLTFRSLKER